MNCAEIRKRIRGKIERGHSPQADPVLMRHLKECELCRRFCTDLLLQRTLQQMPVENPRDGFAEEAIQRAVGRNRKRARRNFFLGLSAAAIMLMAIGASLILDRMHPPAFFADTPETAVFMPAGGEKTVRIVVETADARSNATFTVDLSGGVKLQSHPDRQRLQWQTELPRGRNLLELPLVLKEKSDGYVNIRYTYNGFETETRILLTPEKAAGKPGNKRI